MNWFIGVDGGGSKTDFILSGKDGKVAANLRRGGCSYHMLGVDKAAAMLAEGVLECLARVDAKPADCGGCCIGIPCYGENPVQDSAMAQALQAALPSIPLSLVNDVEVGWAGALECGDGIHLVAGTGSIAFGRGSDGQMARCGGWNEFFGDEGSCYWIGRQAMSLFSKESDGRVPRGALYEIVRQELSLEHDFQFIDVVLRDWAPYRDKVALFQPLAEQAALRGDTAAKALFEQAAQELALMIEALTHKLRLPAGEIPVSYSGGLFKTGELILAPLRKAAEALGCTLTPPHRSPAQGALMLAIQLGKGETDYVPDRTRNFGYAAIPGSDLRIL